MARTKKTEQVVRTHDGMDKVEADFSLIVPISEVDTLVGQPKNPEYCAIAEGAKRLFGCTFASVGVSRASFALLDPDGVRRLYQFSVPPVTRKAIEQFDLTGTIPLGGFRFNAVKGSDTRAYRKKMNDQRKLEGYVPAQPRGPHPDRIQLAKPTEAKPRLAPTRDGRSVNRKSTLKTMTGASV